MVHFLNYLSGKTIRPIKKEDGDIFKDEEEPIWF
jgi:hypothetical protein